MCLHMRRTGILSIMAAAVLAAPALAEPSLRLIVHQMDESVEIYASLKAEDLPWLLDAEPSGLAAPDGRVYYGELRQNGTFLFGDDMIADIDFAVDGKDALFEAMSVMVHPDDSTLPFETPVDGIMAMSVCLVPDPAVPPQIDELRLYAGIVAYPVAGLSEVTMTLPHTETVSVDMVTYVDGVKSGERTVELAPGQPLIFPETAKQGWAERLGLAWLWNG